MNYHAKKNKENKIADYFFKFDRNQVCNHLNSMIDSFWTKITKNVFIPELVKIHSKLCEMNISENNPILWGDIDGKLYQIPFENKKIIVFTTQNAQYLYILSPIMAIEYFPNKKDKFGKEYETYSIHIRRIWPLYKNDMYSLKYMRKNNLQTIINYADQLNNYADDDSKYPRRPSINIYKKINFDLDHNHKSPMFYGDFSDPGYILSYNDRYQLNTVKGTSSSNIELQYLLDSYLQNMKIELNLI